MSSAWFKTIRKVLLQGADAAKAAFPTKIISRLTRDELVKKAKGILPADFDRRGYTISKKQVKRENLAAAKEAAAPKVVKTAVAKKPAVNINTNTSAPKPKAGKK